MQDNPPFVAGRPRPSGAVRAVGRFVALISVVFCILNPCTSKTQTLQDAIKEACAPSHYPFLPPCGNQITLEELTNRLNYKLHMMEAEDAEMKTTMSTWNKLLGMLYMNPTQTVWESTKQAARALSTDLVWPQASKAIDLQGVIFLANTNGNDELVRNKILRYMIINNGLDNSSVEALESLGKQKIEPKSVFHIETGNE